MAKGTKPNTMEFIRSFYLEAYDRIRKYLPEEKYVVIHDAFELKAWKDFMREDKYKNVVLDRGYGMFPDSGRIQRVY